MLGSFHFDICLISYLEVKFNLDFLWGFHTASWPSIEKYFVLSKYMNQRSNETGLKKNIYALTFNST